MAREDEIRALISKDNPYFRHADGVLFLAVLEGQSVGRVGAWAGSRASSDVGRFGLLECVNDLDVVSALLAAASNWLERRGCHKVLGPIDPSAFVAGGLMIKGWEEQEGVGTAQTPEFLPGLLEQIGFRQSVDLLAWRYGQRPVPKQAKLISRAVSHQEGLIIRPIDFSHFESELDHITKVYNSAWRGNWGYCPVDREDMRSLLRDGAIIDPEISFLVFMDGEPAALSIGTPNIPGIGYEDRPRLPGMSRLWFETTRGKLKWLRHRSVGRPESWRQLLFGIVPQFRGGALGGLGAHLYVRLRERAEVSGYKIGEATWTNVESRVLNSGLKVLGAEQHKTFRIYERDIFAS